MKAKPLIMAVKDLVHFNGRQRRAMLGDVHWKRRTHFVHEALGLPNPDLAYYAHKRDLCVVVKPTSRCDAGCIHCSSYREHTKADMDEKVLGKMYAVLFSYARRHHIKVINFTWHGGEPTILGKRFYEKAWSMAGNVPDIHIIHKMQTHLCTLDDEWMALFKKYRIQVGSSIDPIDPGMRIYRGRSMFSRVMKHFAMATEGDLGLGFVYVVSPRNRDRVGDFYNFIKNLASRAKAPIAFKINPLYASGRASFEQDPSLLISARAYGQYLIEFWNLLKHDKARLRVSPYVEWVNRMGMSCEHSGGCCEHFLTIDGSGDVYNCGRYFDLGHVYGNIFDSPMDAILMNAERISLFDRETGLKTGSCRNCLAWDFCHGGCPYFAEVYHGDRLGKDPFCEAYKMLFYETDILKHIKKRRHNEYPPEVNVPLGEWEKIPRL